MSIEAVIGVAAIDDEIHQILRLQKEFHIIATRGTRAAAGRAVRALST